LKGWKICPAFSDFIIEDYIMRETIDGLTNTVNPDVFMATNGDWFDTDRLTNCLLKIAEEVERVIPLTGWESENNYSYFAESMYTSFLDMFQKPLTMAENASDKALVNMREAKESGNGLKASQALDRYKVANARIDRFERALPALVQQFAELTGGDYQTPQIRARAYSMLTDKKMALMAEIDELLK